MIQKLSIERRPLREDFVSREKLYGDIDSHDKDHHLSHDTAHVSAFLGYVT